MSWRRGDPIVVFGDDWGRFVSTVQHLFRHIAADHPVIWVNAIGHRVPGLNATDLRRAWEKLRAITAPAPAVAGSGLAGGALPQAIIQPRVLPWHGIKAIHAYNNKWLANAIRARLAELNLTRPPALVTVSPPAVGVVGRLGEAAAVYLCQDDFLNYPGVSAKLIAPLERRLLQQIDVLVATARSLTETKAPASGVSYHLPQGVNYDHFATPRPEPADLRDIPRPRIGFAGTISSCCDFALLQRIARNFPDASLVFVGPHTVEPELVDQLRAPNVHILGPRPYADLPAYVQGFDVGIVPYILNDWTLAVDPLKLLEYLAAGVGVVSTDIPEASKYAPTVRVARDGDDFLVALREALKKDRSATAAAGRNLAQENTWRHRADRLVSIIEEASAARRQPSERRAAQLAG